MWTMSWYGYGLFLQDGATWIGVVAMFVLIVACGFLVDLSAPGPQWFFWASISSGHRCGYPWNRGDIRALPDQANPQKPGF